MPEVILVLFYDTDLLATLVTFDTGTTNEPINVGGNASEKSRNFLDRHLNRRRNSILKTFIMRKANSKICQHQHWRCSVCVVCAYI